MKTRVLGTRFQEWRQQAGRRARNVGRTTDHYIREHTWQTVAAAVVVGVALGWLFFRGAED